MVKNLETNVVDDVSFGAIVVIRDQLLKLQREGKKVYRLESGDPSFDLPDNVKKGIEDALRNGKTHYTDSTGIPELREAIANKLLRKNGIKSASPSNVVVTNGGMNGLYVAFRSLISRDDEVIIPNPMWTEIAEIIKLSDGKPVYVPIEKYGKPEEFPISPKTKAIFINSPHNPTGKVLTAENIRNIVKIAEENDIFIVSDEAYEDVIFDGRRHTSPASLYENTISLYSMSKSFAMSGLRLGYVHSSNEKIIERMKKMLRCTINGVNSITQYGAIEALNGPQDYIDMMRSEYQRRRDIIYDGVKNSRYLEPLYPEGAFYLWAKIREFPEGTKDSWDFSKYLLDKTSVGSTPGPVFRPNNAHYIRFAFSAKTEDIREATDFLKNLI